MNSYGSIFIVHISSSLYAASAMTLWKWNRHKSWPICIYYFNVGSRYDKCKKRNRQFLLFEDMKVVEVYHSPLVQLCPTNLN